MALMLFLGSIPFLGPWLRGKIQKWRNPHCCEPAHTKEDEP